MAGSGHAIPLAVFMTASGHGGGRCSPLSASGMGSAAGEPGVRCGRVWGRLLSPSLLLSLKCGCSVSSLCEECCFLISTCSYLERPRVAAVASASGAGVRLCPPAVDEESAALVLLRRLLLASAPPCRFRARFAGRRSRWGVLDARSSRSLLVRSGAEFEFWRPGALCWFPVCSTLRQLKSSRSSSNLSRWLLSGFLPPTAGLSFIGGTSACSGPLRRVTSISLAFGLASAVFHCGGGFTRGYGWSPVFPSFGSSGRRRLMYP